MDEVKNFRGAVDIPDSRDFSALHLLGDPDIEIPPYTNLDKVPSHNQGRSMHCTAYALTHVMEILNTLEHNLQALADPEEQWANQATVRGMLDRMELEGDSLQNALQTLIKFGLYNKNTQIGLEKFKADGYARIGNTVDDMRKWLATGFPIYTGSGNHCYLITGHEDATREFRAKNSYGPTWGSYKDGSFRIGFDEIGKLFTRYIVYDHKDLKMIYKDVAENSPHAEGIKFNLELGLMRGYGAQEDAKDRLFMPNQPVSRAEQATMNMRMWQKWEERLKQVSKNP